jgi:hypothetical protein
VTAYDELNAFQFKGGKGYDKRSVEEFRARTLNVLDDVLRANVHLEERLAHQAQPQAALGPALSADEQDLLDRYRSLTSTQRYELLQRLDGSEVGAAATFAAGLDHWADDSWTPSAAQPANEPAVGEDLSRTWENERSSVAGHEPFATSNPQPDWLAEWESVVPLDPVTSNEQPWDWHEPSEAPLDLFSVTPTDGKAVASADLFNATHAIFEIPFAEPTPSRQAPDSLPSLEGGPVDCPTPSQWAPPASQCAATTLTSFMPPAEPENEVGVPIASDVVISRPEHRFQESPLSPERLDDLFSQLDFGPPSLDLLPHVHAGATDLAPHGAPMHVALAPQDDLPLPPPVRPWEGWIK